MSESYIFRPIHPKKVTKSGAATASSKLKSGPKGQNKSKKGIIDDGEVIYLSPKASYKSVTRNFSGDFLISSDASGTIPLASISASGLITALGSEFTNFAQEFQEYKVVSLGVRFFPSTTSATSSTGPYQGGLIGSAFQGLAPTATSSIQQAEQLVKFSTLEEREIVVSAASRNNEWTITTASLPAKQNFGFAYYGLGSLAVSSRIFVALEEVRVIFRGTH